VALGDLPEAELRALLHRAADLAADYLDAVETYPVLARTRPGEVAGALPRTAPEEGEPWEDVLRDYQAILEPNLTHWNHPRFFGYFAISGSAPGIAAETLAAALNVNAMLWRTSPAATELEERVCDWLRQLIGLPEAFHGHLNDTASISSFVALAAARDRACPEVHSHGLGSRPEFGQPTVYASQHAHSSIDKAVIALGLGLENLRKIACDEEFRLRPGALAAAIATDRAAGRRPMAIVATAGTTATTAVDPLEDVAAIARREKLWLHVDAAYAGSAAICPELRPLFAGWEQADSIVVNPHKWLFVPVDCSVLWVRDPEDLRRAFSLVPDYLKTPERGVTNLMDLGIQLGRRFRALKLWMVLRCYGAEGLRQRLRAHCAMAANLRRAIDLDPDFEAVAPTLFSTVCFRARGSRDDEAWNAAIQHTIDRSGVALLSSTKLDGRTVLRWAIGNLRTTQEDIDLTWQAVREAAEKTRPAQ
jgi:aromatic-L-amino-acid decarboxylase